MSRQKMTEMSQRKKQLVTDAAKERKLRYV